MFKWNPIFSPLYNEYFIPTQWGLEGGIGKMSENCQKNVKNLVFLTSHQMIVLAFLRWLSLSFMWSKLRRGKNPLNTLQLVLPINARLLSAHKIFYKSPMTPGGTWVIKSAKQHFSYLPRISYWLPSGYLLCLFNIC